MAFDPGVANDATTEADPSTTGAVPRSVAPGPVKVTAPGAPAGSVAVRTVAWLVAGAVGDAEKETVGVCDPVTVSRNFGALMATLPCASTSSTMYCRIVLTPGRSAVSTPDEGAVLPVSGVF